MRIKSWKRAVMLALAAVLTLNLAGPLSYTASAANPVNDLHALPLPWPQSAVNSLTPQPPDPTVPYLPGLNPICPQGDRACVQALQNDLFPVENQLQCDRKAVFNDAYITITQGALDYGLTTFWDPKADRLYHEATNYGREYLKQYDLYRTGQYSQMAKSWYEAYKAADAKTNTGTGDILMQLAAHIIRDNPIRAVEQSESILRGPGPMPGSSGRDLHNDVNLLLQDMLPPMMAHLASVYDPTMDDATNLFGVVMDQRGIYAVTIQNWREWSWRAGENLRKIRAQYGPNSNQYKNALKYVDTVATGTVTAIKAATLEVVLPGQQTREQYCNAHFVPVNEAPGSRPYWMPTPVTPIGG